MTIGEIIRKKRKAMKLTQLELSEKIQVTTITIHNWENNVVCPTALSLCDLADFFGCTTDELLGRKECT